MKKRLLATILVAFVFLAGCSSANRNESKDTTASSEISQAASESTTTSAAESETTAAETKSADLVLPVTENTSGKVQIQTVSASSNYPYISYLITSTNGEIVVVDPTVMPYKKTIDLHPAAIVSTHNHGDHMDLMFNKANECPQLMYTVEDMNTNDFHIYTVATSHADDNVSDNSGNIIAIFEVDGLRIAHFGDCGQTALTDEQLEKIGKIDIAFMQFENTFSNMSVYNQKGFNVMKQVNPTIVIPTHCSNPGFEEIDKNYGGLTQFENILEISKEDLPEDQLHFYQITNTHKYN